MSPNLEEETFCIYCQKEYGTPRKLRRHVLKVHPGTYRAEVYLEDEEAQSGRGKGGDNATA